MNYCNNCQCEECQAARRTHAPEARAKADAYRVVAKAGDSGLTSSELEKRSRPFRALVKSQRGSVLDQLVAEGALIQHTFPPAAGRGKSRSAFLAVRVSQ